MTSPDLYNSLIRLVSDISQDLPAQERYSRLLQEVVNIFPCDAAALLQFDNNYLKPLAVKGLSPDTMGRRFKVDEHPRFQKLLHSRDPIRFAANSQLPDPYDGLVENIDHKLNVHDCMGASLHINNQPWGVLTLDAMDPHRFDHIEPVVLKTFIGLAEATVKAADRISELAARAEYEHQVATTLQEQNQQVEIVGKSLAIEKLRNEIDVVARSDLTVLILGETGVGKELVAKSIHNKSQRNNKSLVYVNCAALPEGIAESELFGHVKGAFTGAAIERAGKFEIANGGTLFLDEIGELPLTLQAKLLRVLQSGEIQRVGSDKYREVDVRIVAATNRNLLEEIEQKQFRADLYHRLSVYPITVPPLREREDDILLLAGFFMEANQRRLGVRGLRLSQSAQQALLVYNWPGNVRELEHLISRAALRAISEKQHQDPVILQEKNLGLDFVTDTDSFLDRGDISDLSQQWQQFRDFDNIRDAQDAFLKYLIEDRLNQFNNNRSAVARSLGLDRGNFHRLIKRLSL